MAINPIARVSVDMTMDNGAVVNLAEGDIVRGLKYRSSGKTITVDGAVRVINAVTKVKNTNTAVCIHEPYLHEYITVQSIILDSSDEFDSELNTIQIASIISIDSVEKNAGAITVGSGSQFKPLVDIIADAPAGSTIKLMSGTYDANMDLNKDIKIIGDGTVELVGTINIKKTTNGGEMVRPNIHLEGLTLSDKANVNIDGAKEFTLKNCVIGGFTPEVSTQPIHFLNSSPDPIMVTIEDNEFLANNDKCYNLINIYGKFMDGSSISRNTFRKGCSTHNIISFFAVDDGATVYFNDNYCEKSANMVHIQIPGEPKCTVMMENNRYDETDANVNDAGLFLVQPFEAKTTTYKDVNIYVNNTTKPEGQLGYVWMHGKNTQLTDEQMPSVYVDGVKTDLPVYHV